MQDEAGAVTLELLPKPIIFAWFQLKAPDLACARGSGLARSPPPSAQTSSPSSPTYHQRHQLIITLSLINSTLRPELISLQVLSHASGNAQQTAVFASDSTFGMLISLSTWPHTRSTCLLHIFLPSWCEPARTTSTSFSTWTQSPGAA